MVPEAGRRGLEPSAQAFQCDNCSATWTAEAVREGSKGGADCLLCEGPLTPIYAD